MSDEITIKKKEIRSIIFFAAIIIGAGLLFYYAGTQIKDVREQEEKRIGTLENKTKVYEFYLAKLINSTREQNQINSYLNERINILNTTENHK